MHKLVLLLSAASSSGGETGAAFEGCSVFQDAMSEEMEHQRRETAVLQDALELKTAQAEAAAATAAAVSFLLSLPCLVPAARVDLVCVALTASGCRCCGALGCAKVGR